MARVVVDVPLAHLDRPFDYLVPPELDEQVVPGCRVKVRFAGRRVAGYVVERVATSAHDKLAPIATVVSSEPVLRPEVLALAREVADRYAGSLVDVLRLAVPPRHARGEKAPRPEPVQIPDPEVAPPRGRTVWTALPTDDVAREVARLAAATARDGRGVVICLPDGRDVQRWSATFAEVLGPDAHVELTAALSAERRYRSYLAAARGDRLIVLGTRAAAYAPVHDLGLVVVVDDGDDAHAEPHAPYPHTREVLLLRSARTGAAALLVGHARSVEAQSLVESGWANDRSDDSERRRAAWPRVEVTDGSEAGTAPVRLPQRVVRLVRDADGPVLVQVPRRGYRTALACQRCRTPARCRACEGPLAQHRGGADPVCRWCGHSEPWQCTHCSGTALRAPVVGHVRTAEEFARTFADRRVVTSGGEAVLDQVDDPASLVLATPGAEPPAVAGYALVVLLDTWLTLARDDVRVVEESHRRWFNAMALARPDGRVVAVGDAALLQGLVRTDPVSVAVRELADRTATHLPPAGRLATIDGPAAEIEPLAGQRWTPHTEVLGPVPVAAPSAGASPEGEAPVRLVLRAPRSEGGQLAADLRRHQAERSRAKLPPWRIRVDPPTF